MRIELTQSKFAVIDDADFELIQKRKWYFHKGYALSSGKRNGAKKRDAPTYMHRLINKTPDGIETDHIDRDTLNNRRLNLRSVTTAQNQMNKKSQINSTSKYKGVFWDKQSNKWKAQIYKDGKKYSLGFFPSEDDAAKAYTIKAEELFASFRSRVELVI
jgi:hypothetical protein